MSNYRQKKKKLRQLVKKQQEERIKKIQDQGHLFKNTDSFKRSEKHYKFYVHRNTDFSNLIQIDKLNSRKVLNYQVYELEFPKGAYLVKKFSDEKLQLRIGYQSLNQYIHPPYRTNLDGTNGLYGQTLEKKQQQNIIETILTEGNQNQISYYFNENIRMANLGYQYDWPHRSYPSTKVPVPKIIDNLTKRAHILYNAIVEKQTQYRSQAIIVNYYKKRDYMTGHLDDGEEDQVNPIFSFCFGLSCVFLLGGPTREQEPTAIKLEAGDLLIMSGFSRICYHGVPRIIEDSYQQPQQVVINDLHEEFQKQKDNKHKNGIKQIINYYKTHRININIRQVYKYQ